ncbi:unnamed protein product [Caenorhabditis bovis]|uniref:Potassium channel domain-containing protein n=1 Tax=Caenorhabditis bovis TaxID=2654633 RepID=A0A8S1E8Z2_9PELO|nr:unnamed protein product [Caenorhabditis bovis]
MAPKGAGLAAMMAGRPVVVKKKRTVFWRLKLLTRQGGLHVGLIIVCILYAYFGAMLFMSIEMPEEEKLRKEVEIKFEMLRSNFMRNVEIAKNSHQAHSSVLNESLELIIDDYSKQLMHLFSSPVPANMFDCMFYSNSNYTPIWYYSFFEILQKIYIHSYLGYGFIAPLTNIGRILLCVYAGFGIPLALVMMSDIGKFFCDSFVKLFNDNVTAFMSVLIILLFAYSIVGGMIIAKGVGMTMIEGIYFSTITIFTIGYGDMSPDIPGYLVVIFTVIGVSLVTIAVDVVAANIIHHISLHGPADGKSATNRRQDDHSEL